MVGGLIGGFVTPTEASALGVIMILIYGKFFDDSLSLTKIYELAVQTIRQTSIVMMIVAGSSILGQFLANEQLPQQIAEALMVVTDSYVLKLILINAFLLILGMFLHAAAAIIVVVPILLPVAVGMGIDPVHFGVIVCLNLGIGQQTPPVASVLLTVCSATGLGVGEVMNYAKWFIVSMIVTLMIVSFMPWTALMFL